MILVIGASLGVGALIAFLSYFFCIQYEKREHDILKQYKEATPVSFIGIKQKDHDDQNTTG
jgi:hypothetical protein